MADHLQRSPIAAALENNNETLTEHLFQKLHEFEDKKLLMNSVSDVTYTGKQIIQEAETVGAHLWAMGLRPRDVIAFYGGNSSEYMLVLLGAFRIGATVALLNAMAVAGDVHREIERTQASVLYTDATCVQNALKGAAGTQLKSVIIHGQHPGCISISSLRGSRPRGIVLPQIRELGLRPQEDVACIFFSSGTTGLPKGVLLTHTNMVLCISLVIHPSFDLPQAPIPLFQPLAHIYGTMVSLSCLVVGTGCILIPSFSLEEYVKLIAKNRVPLLALVPPISVMLAKSGLIQKYDLSCVTTVANGAAPLPYEVGDDLQKQLGENIVLKQGYGLTETGGIAIATPGGTYAHLNKPLHPGSIGVLFPGVEAKVVDIVSGEALGPEKEGEIWIRSPLNMKGYLNNPKATVEAIDKDGFMHTGDIGFYDANGCWYVVDRLKELIKYKANQVPPTELENVLLTHPAVADVAVIGVPDLMAGELPMAWVVRTPNVNATEKEIADFLAGKVAPYKKLRGGVRFVSAIPKSPSGKILRRLMKDAIKQEQEKNKKAKL